MIHTLGTAVLLSLSAVRAQELGSEETSKPTVGVKEIPPLKAAFEQRLTAAFLPQERRYVEELEKLEKGFANEKNYAAAEQIRLAREESEQRILSALKRIESDSDSEAPADSSAEPPALSSTSIYLDLPKAILSGGARLDPITGAIAGFVERGAAAEWELHDIEPGGYEVTLFYQAATNGGGILRVSENFFHLDIPIPSAGEYTKSGYVAGTLRIREGNFTFRLEATQVTNSKLMILTGVELNPAFTTSP